MKFLSIKDLLEGKRYNDLEKPKLKPNFRQPINTSDTNRLYAGKKDENNEINKEENLVKEEPQILDNLNTTADSPDSPDSPEPNSKSKENIINENEEEKSKEDNDNVIMKDANMALTEQDTNKQPEPAKNKKEDEKNDPNKVDFVKENIRKMKLHFGKRLPKKKETLENDKENIVKQRKPMKIVYRKPELLKNPFSRYSVKKKQSLLLKTPRIPKVIEVEEVKEEESISLADIETSSEIENEKPVEVYLPRKVSSKRLENLQMSINKIRRETNHISRAPLPKHKLYKDVTNLFSNIDEQIKAISVSGIDERLKRRMRQKAMKEAKEKRKRKQLDAFQRQRAGTNINKNKINKNSPEKIFNQAGDWQNEISNSRIVRTSLPKPNLGILKKSKREEIKNSKTVAQQKQQPPLKFISFKTKKVTIQHVGKVFKSNKQSTAATTTSSKKENVKNLKQFLANKPKVSTKWNKTIPTKYEILTKNSTKKTLSKLPLRQF